jgi:hypothetical protein
MVDDCLAIKLMPPTLRNPIEFEYDSDGKIIGWRSTRWMTPEDYEEYKNASRANPD